MHTLQRFRRLSGLGRVAARRLYELQAFAQALNVTTDDLLGIGAKRKAATPAISTRLERRLRLIERMPAKPKQQLLGLIDTFIAANSK